MLIRETNTCSWGGMWYRLECPTALESKADGRTQGWDEHWGLRVDCELESCSAIDRVFIATASVCLNQLFCNAAMWSLFRELTLIELVRALSRLLCIKSKEVRTRSFQLSRCFWPLVLRHSTAASSFSDSSKA